MSAAMRRRWPALAFRLYVAAFFVYLAAPLAASCLFAFNDSLFPSLPWRGFTLAWCFGAEEPKLGLFNDRRLMQSLWTSVWIGAVVSAVSTLVGVCNAFLFERHEFPGKRALYLLMIAPLVVPGIILGISILVLASAAATEIEDLTGVGAGALRPGPTLVVLGQVSFLVTVVTLILAARLRKFDPALEEAALNLGAGRLRVLATVTLPFLMPAVLSSLIVAFLVSFENFSTTLMLTGSEPTLTVAMYDRMAKAGSTPVLNAMSVVLVSGCGLLAFVSTLFGREPARRTPAPLPAENAGEGELRLVGPSDCHRTVGSPS